eukprot:scaffold5679_cov410-Prasinococcus_capsulatus_cf.AAC.2
MGRVPKPRSLCPPETGGTPHTQMGSASRSHRRRSSRSQGRHSRSTRGRRIGPLGSSTRVSVALNAEFGTGRTGVVLVVAHQETVIVAAARLAVTTCVHAVPEREASVRVLHTPRVNVQLRILAEVKLQVDADASRGLLRIVLERGVVPAWVRLVTA